ncbi:MAG TPA: hypothetical protein VGB22_05605 [candidate division Zixibacteria bacterium]
MPHKKQNTRMEPSRPSKWLPSRSLYIKPLVRVRILDSPIPSPTWEPPASGRRSEAMEDQSMTVARRAKVRRSEPI